MNSAESERAAIVAWLRETLDIHLENQLRDARSVELRHHINACKWIIEAIEAGEHINASQPTSLSDTAQPHAE